MNKLTQRTIWYAGISLLGGVLIAMGENGFLEDFWSGLGMGLLLIGILRLIQILRYRRDEEYAQRIMVRNHDERNLFLAEKARSWTFYSSILAEAIAVVILRVFNHAELSSLMGYLVCGQMLIYWILWVVLRKKY